MEPLTVVFWENEPQFAVFNPFGSDRRVAAGLEQRLDEILAQVKAEHGDDWDCSDFQKAIRKAGYRTNRKIPVDDQSYWRYDAR